MRSLDIYFRSNHIVRDEAHEQSIWQSCMIHDAMPIIEDIPGGGPIKRVWYGYAVPKAKEVVIHPGWEKYVQELRKRNAARVEEDEQAIEHALALWLENQGLWVDRQVVLQAGVADIVAGDMLIEVKRKLTRDAVIKAVGQVLLYGAELGVRRLVIAGRSGDGVKLAQQLKRLGIELWVWRDPGPMQK